MKILQTEFTMGQKSDGGLVVETKDGERGYWFYSDGKINGKAPVYIIDKNYNRLKIIDKNGNKIDKKILCDPYSLKHIGFFD